MAKPSRFPPQMNPDLTPELIMLKCNQADINIQLELFSSLTIPTLFTSLNSKLISQNLFLLFTNCCVYITSPHFI
jgi:hypothetical protein